MGVGELPGSLGEALDELDKEKVLKNTLGSTIYEAFTRAKWEEWDTYRTSVSDWEVGRYLKTV